jgi:haloalkane dehalogenase
MSFIDPDPTITALAAYPMTWQEIVIGWFVLATVPIMYLIGKTLHPGDGRGPSLRTTRTPEKYFSDVYEPYRANYLYVQDPVHKRDFRVHYLDEGDPSSTEVIVCLHGEPFWSHSFHKIIPLLTAKGYRVIAPDFVGFGRSDKYVDWKAYTLDLHKETITKVMHHLGLDDGYKNTTLLAHNWGLLSGAAVIRDNPDLFHRLIIMNVNSFPDGELVPSRFPSLPLFNKFLIYDAFFLTFPSSIFMLQNFFPLTLLWPLLNPSYSINDINGFNAPFRRIGLDRGGVVAFPLMVPVFPSHPYTLEFRAVRKFFQHEWKRPTLIAFSEKAILPLSLAGTGDFIIGNRRQFFQQGRDSLIHYWDFNKISLPVLTSAYLVYGLYNH